MNTSRKRNPGELWRHSLHPGLEEPQRQPHCQKAIYTCSVAMRGEGARRWRAGLGLSGLQQAWRVTEWPSSGTSSRYRTPSTPMLMIERGTSAQPRPARTSASIVHNEIPLCSAIGVDSPEALRDRVRQSSDYAAYKVKIGGDPDSDVAAIRAVAEVAGGKPIWLDANQSYRPSALRELLDAIVDVPGVHCVEQPVPSTDTLAMRRLRSMVSLPIAIDEGRFTAADLARAVQLDAADLVVVKICKSGGLRNALKTAQVGLANGLELLASGLTDRGVGFAAALHLFCQLDLALPAELNGPELLADLYVTGLEITKAVATVPTAPGLGVEVDEDRIRADAKDLTFL